VVNSIYGHKYIQPAPRPKFSVTGVGVILNQWRLTPPKLPANRTCGVWVVHTQRSKYSSWGVCTAGRRCRRRPRGRLLRLPVSARRASTGASSPPRRPRVVGASRCAVGTRRRRRVRRPHAELQRDGGRAQQAQQRRPTAHPTRYDAVQSSQHRASFYTTCKVLVKLRLSPLFILP